MVKVDTYLKNPTFPASNGKCYNFLNSFWSFECIPRVLVIRWTLKLHENSGVIFDKFELFTSHAIYSTLFRITDSERNQIESWVVTVEL